jgi:hypothetical protein
VILGDEPACWSWPLPPQRSRAEEIAVLLAEQEGRDVNGRLSLEAVELLTEDLDVRRFGIFHDQRCAICGDRGQHLVFDHCHSTGQWRGMLCRSCNTREGVCGDPAFVAYRRRHPAAILDVYEMYTGIGWNLGWPLITYGAEAFERGIRPRTPWPRSEARGA